MGLGMGRQRKSTSKCARFLVAVAIAVLTRRLSTQTLAVWIASLPG